MTDEREFFSPEKVDEQVDHLLLREVPPRLFHRQQTAGSGQAEKRLVQDLRHYYQGEQEEDRASLERAWKCVSPHLAMSTERPQLSEKPLSSDMLRISQERNRKVSESMSEYSAKRKTVRWPGLLAAIVVVCVLVGGLIAILNLSRPPAVPGASHIITPAVQPTPTSQPVGTTVYTSPPTQGSYRGFAWSYDSKRVAVLGGNSASGVQIWDATTGAHAITVVLPGQNEWVMTMAWSPVKEEIALGTNQHLLIVDGQTGAILHTYTSNVVFNGRFASPYLSSQMSTSGGLGYRALGWSPDGKYLAAGISAGASGGVQVWNMQTSVVISNVDLGGGYVITSLAWSSDSAYLAGQGYNTQTGLNNIVAVWKAATNRVVFQKNVSLDGSDAPIYWQPRSHNLAFVAFANQSQELEIWNVTTGQKVLHYADKGSDLMAFSPDGKELAYSGAVGSGKNAVGAIIIIDVSSGALVYAYKNSSGALAWSPDGRYIISTSGGQIVMQKNGMPIMKNGRMETTPAYVKVWIA